MDIISVDDSDKYNNETLRNINKYYFRTIFSDEIPYKDQSKLAINDKRESINNLINHFESIYENCLNDIVTSKALEMPSYQASELKIERHTDYIEAFCTQLFNTFTLEQIQNFNSLANTNLTYETKQEINPDLNTFLSYDYSSGDSSFISKELKLKPTDKTVFTFNKMLLGSGIVRDFISQKSTEAITTEKKKEYLKFLIEKKGLQFHSQI